MSDDDRTVIAAADPDRTILMPSPGGQATVATRRARAGGAKSGAAVELQRLVAGVNPLLGAANVLLALVAQLRATTAHADPAGLRRQLLERVNEFETLAGGAGVPAHQVSAARYLLCSFLDEVIEATPWGAGGTWAQRNLLQEFHDERSGGDKAFKLLEKLGEDVVGNRHLLELFYVCLALGFEGRYRGARNGREQLDAIAERVLESVRPMKERQPVRSLSLHWEGVATRGNRDLSVLPLWVVFVLGAALVLGTVLLLNAQLGAQASPLFRQIHELAAALRVERPAVAAKPRLAPLLGSDVASGAVEVRDEALRSVLTLPADALFVPGSARVEPQQMALLSRVAGALKGLNGQIVVVGHTDDAPTASLQFPSNWHLSRERAQAALAALVQQGLPAERARAEGRADVEPRSPERAKNRRIEIELQLARPDSP
ncbi:MAG TPA: type IVB secretion system protein IcmH/DotU [Albitalea sp.]|nr:type IVB secretion system protein IcmH/DotU [Albitalea sp.]